MAQIPELAIPVTYIEAPLPAFQDRTLNNRV
jgi:hypothetical protein